MFSGAMVYITVFGAPLALIFSGYFLWQKKNGHSARRKLEEAQTSGLLEPASLHPVIDPSRCLGCATCVSACPEGEILGLINRKAQLVSPSSCIGHGACREACPTNAISLVFGSATRGVEIPFVSPDFETSVPGIYIAGELGGMGLIKNAVAQGQQAVDAISSKLQKKIDSKFDLVIVGAGPAGLSAALAAEDKGLKCTVLEQDSIGGTISHYPRGKIVMTQPANLPIVGKMQFREASKEALIEFWDSVLSKVKLDIQTGQRVEQIESITDGFVVKTSQGEFGCSAVLLAMGRRGTPRKLGVKGEEQSKVVYRLVDPEQYINSNVVVVGGGDSALEAALAISEQPGTTTTLSYRSPAFSRAKSKNREKVEVAEKNGQLQVLLESNVVEISESTIILNTKSGTSELKNDAVLVCAGGILPTPFLKSLGIEVEEKFGNA